MRDKKKYTHGFDVKLDKGCDEIGESEFKKKNVSFYRKDFFLKKKQQTNKQKFANNKGVQYFHLT